MNLTGQFTLAARQVIPTGQPRMVRRLFDLTLAIPALIVIAPVMLIAAMAIKRSSRGPVFYRAARIGRQGRVFTMFKLRTMHVRPVAGSSITSADDPRVFRVGRWLRALKIDELPQLLNIVRGEMSVVGPRPEAPDIVARHYSAEDMRSLEVRPGLTSPGSIFYYTHGEQLLADGEAEQFYVERLLPLKMKLDLEYIQRASVVSDLFVVLRTGAVLAMKLIRRSSRKAVAMLPGTECSVPMTGARRAA
jgi:lipopolysaccharide/colanic/teichoic acid biosynthesis glycosyltransferase